MHMHVRPCRRLHLRLDFSSSINSVHFPLLPLTLFFFHMLRRLMFSLFFFFNDTATTEIYTLSLHDALPICQGQYALCHGSILLKPRCLVVARQKSKASPQRLGDAEKSVLARSQ